MSYSQTGTRRAYLKSLFGELQAENILQNPRTSVYNPLDQDQDPSFSEKRREIPNGTNRFEYWNNIGLRTYLLWLTSIAWVLAMLIGGSFILSSAVKNDDLATQLKQQQKTIESQFCEFCRPDDPIPTMLKNKGLYEVDPTTEQFLSGYKTVSHNCMLGSMSSFSDLEYETLTISGNGVFVLSNSRLAPEAETFNSLPFLMHWDVIFQNATSTAETRCVVNSTLPYTGQTIFYLVNTDNGPFPCICQVDSGIEECYNFPKDMGNVNPIIDNTNSGIIP